MKIAFFLFISLISTTILPQSNLSILTDKLRPVTYQAERVLAQDIKTSLEEVFIGERISVNVSLDVSASKLARRAGISANRMTFALPGLDESISGADEDTRQFEPSINDVYYSANSMLINVSIFREWTEEEKRKAQSLIQDKVKTLNISNVDIKFEVKPAAKPEAKNLTTSVEAVKSGLPEDLPYIIAGSILVAVIVLSLIIYLVVSLGMKRMENMTQNFGSKLNDSLQGLNMGMPAASSQFQPYNPQQTPEDLPPSKPSLESYEEIKSKIVKFLASHQSDLTPIFNYIESQGEAKTLFIFLDSLSESDRTNWKNKISDHFKKDFRDFLSQVSIENYDLSANLKNHASQLYRDLNLFSHDPELLKKQSLKSKVKKLDRMSLARFIEQADAREFSFITQLTDPVQLSSVLNSYPHLLQKFDKIPKVSLALQEMDLFQKRVDDHLINQKESILDEVSLGSFLPPALEAELNLKMGIGQSSFDILTKDQLSALIPFAAGLTINQLSAFIAILPEAFKDQIISSLPDIKAQQIARRGINITDESFRLKHQFLTQKTGSLQ